MKKQILLLIFLLLNIVWANAQDAISEFRLLSGKAFLYERMDFEIKLSSAFANPYDAHEIALDMVLTSPTQKTLVLPCFYVSGKSSQSVWNARFLPQESGEYSYCFRLSKNQVDLVTTPSEKFSVSSSAKDGILHADTNWNFRFDSGKLFRGIGENVGWEAREWEDQSYRYEYFLPKLAKNGVNFFRTWTCIWNLPIEWRTVKDTKFFTSTTEYFNPGGIKRMDEVIEMIDSLGMHMMLALVPHGALITTGEWSYNPYNIKNGGPASTPTEFFTLDQSKQKFKNTLRYLIARWGYSPGIGAWEFCNEIDNAAYNGGNTLSIPEAAITQWHKEMSEYLQKTDLYGHLVTTSISHREIQGMYNVPEMDFNQQHIYNSTSTIASKIVSQEAKYGKPHVIGEFGWDWDWNNVKTENGANFDFDLKRGLWYGLFTATPILPMSWWWEFFDQRNMSYYYKNIASVSEKMLLSGRGEFKPATVTAYGFEKYAVQCGENYFVYILNNTTNPVESPAQLTVSGTGKYYVRSLNTSTCLYSEPTEINVSSGTVDLGKISLNSREERVFIISKTSDFMDESSPFSGTAISLPGDVETEDFDKGADGIAYHDADATNSGSAYRAEVGVDIYASQGRTFVGDIVQGEWLKYAVNFTESGRYAVNVTVASASAGNSFRLLLNGNPISGQVQIPSTGAVDQWQTIDVPLMKNIFQSGNGSLAIEFQGSGFAIDKLVFNLVNGTPVVQWISPDANKSFTYPAQISLKAGATDKDGSISKVSFYAGTQLLSEDTSSPYEINWNPSLGQYKLYFVATDDRGLTVSSDTLSVGIVSENKIPGTIEAEDYDSGANGTSYKDLSSGNKFGFYRQDDVDLESCSDAGGGFSLGDFQTGEWLNYTVKIQSGGMYSVDCRVATQSNGAAMSLSLDGKVLAGNISIPNTGGWQVWTTITVTGIQLTEGVHTLTLGSVAQFVNVNRMVFGGVSSSEVLLQKQIQCYPNPANSILYFSGLPDAGAHVKVCNSLGVLVLDRLEIATQLPVNYLISGLYICEIISRDGNIIGRIKFIKQ